MPQIEPVELKKLLSAGKSICLIDVRQPEEYGRVSIQGAVLIPLMELDSRLEEVRLLISKKPYDAVVIYCRSGGRSEKAITWLESQGIANLRNLRGGINAYAMEADQSLEPY